MAESAWGARPPSRSGSSGALGVVAFVLVLAGLVGAVAWAFSLRGERDAAEARAQSQQSEVRDARGRLSECKDQLARADQARLACEAAQGPERRALEGRLADHARERCAVTARLVQAMAGLQEPGKVRLWQVGARLRLVMRETAIFEVASARVSPAGRLVLGQVALAVKGEPKVQVVVVAQADAEPPARTQRTSWDVAAARGAAVAAALVAEGVGAARTSVRGLGVGSARPHAPGIDELGEDRVEIELDLLPQEREELLAAIMPSCTPVWLTDGGVQDAAPAAPRPDAASPTGADAAAVAPVDAGARLD